MKRIICKFENGEGGFYILPFVSFTWRGTFGKALWFGWLYWLVGFEFKYGLEYKIVRTYSAGVFAGYLKSRNGKEVVILKARRLWAWYGAASLSQLAEEGTSKPNECKFPCEVSKIELTEAIEILSVTAEGQKSIASVPVWQA